MGERYEIVERLDRGGMAEVFRGVAQSLGFKKNVAIKRVLPELAKNEQFVAMFLDEARLSLYLQHANIVQVFDVGKSENSYFLVMEFVDGCNLKKVMERYGRDQQTMDIAPALFVMKEACKALDYAHGLFNPETGEPLRLVHRDISPPNILLSRNGEVKVVDFGLAKATSQLENTERGVVKGKFSYLSPEAAHGQEVDLRADIFAVGIILWEMLTGRRLFFGDTDFETIKLVRAARIPSIRALNPRVEPALEDIVRKALARDPAARYQNAGDLGDALAQYLFSRGLTVTTRNIAGLVTDAVGGKRRAPSLADQVVQNEIDRITSVAETERATRIRHTKSITVPPGDELVDTSSWADGLFDD